MAQMTHMNCDRLAPYYERLEHLSFGRSLERSRFAFLRDAAIAEHAIVCGGGDGRFLARLLRVNARLEVDFVELSAKMLELAERRVAGMGRTFRARVSFREADVREFVPRPGGYDLIVTIFFLDCFSEAELGGVVAQLASWARPEARWLLSDFREGETAIGRLWTRAVIRGLYASFQWTTGLRVTRLPNYTAALARAGYALQREERCLGGLLHCSLWEPSPLRAKTMPIQDLRARS
jgi:SAM-dependent methyltransferase